MDLDRFSDFARQWEQAANPMPVLIVGGGRWGKVWTSVLTDARGSSKHLAMAARTDVAAASSWANESAAAQGMTVCNSISQAVALMPSLKTAIVCSRPRDHLRDVLEAFDYGLHVLVEKPISTKAAHAVQLMERSLQVNRKLAVGTELAFIPAVQQCLQEFGLGMSHNLKASLYWSDPVDETRYGSVKARHEEVDAMNDLLPHAFSIFRTLASSVEFRIADASQDSSGNKGYLLLRNQRSSEFRLMFDLAAQQRRRSVEVNCSAGVIAIDFSSNCSSIKLNGSPYPLNTSLQSLTSTLRLQLGAFFAEIAAPQTEFTLDPTVHALIDLQMELEGFSY